MKKAIGLFLLLSCTPCHYVFEERQFGLEEAIPYDSNEIIKIDTVRNEYVGVIKKVVIRVKSRP